MRKTEARVPSGVPVFYIQSVSWLARFPTQRLTGEDKRGWGLTSNLHLLAAPSAKSRRISQTALSIPEHLRAYGGISTHLGASMSICEHLRVSLGISGRICAHLPECTHRTSDAM